MTFSINLLGNNGHLGNQMFQYAFIKSISKKYNSDFVIPPKEVFGKYYYQKLFSNLDDAFDIQCSRGITDFLNIQERFFHYDEELIKNIPNSNVNFIGFFQSEKYFKNIEDELRNTDFIFKEEILESCSKIVDNYKGSISLHIRRNDFITNPNHPLQNDDYYLSALDELPKDISVLVFSDDIDWCKNHHMFSDDRFLISETENPYYDLYIMSQCKYHIISNSTYSWWGAWLSNSEYVIAPKKWFSGDCINHNTKDLYLNHWKLL